MSAGKMLHTGNFVRTDFKKLEGPLATTKCATLTADLEIQGHVIFVRA